jgi:cation diffusion facilitator CzcD-associated flavoprotein CzcO
MVFDTSGDRLARLQQHIVATDAHHDSSSRSPYKVHEQPLGSTKHIRVVGIGAGASGINMIRTLRLNLTDYELTVYEKNEDVGGTWLENRYPGCRCDVPSHSYQFSWRPNHEWSNFFSPAEEIERYLCRICDEEGMRDTIKTLHRVTSATWDEDQGFWNLRVENLATGEEFDDYAHFLLDGSGILKSVATQQYYPHTTHHGSLTEMEQ